MICQKCGKPLADSAKFCSGCGAPCGNPNSAASPIFDAAGSAAAPIAGYSNYGYNSNQRNASVYTGSDFLIPNIVILIVCCCFPTGIAGLIMSIMARSAKNSGEREKAIVCATAAKTLFFVTPVLAIACTIGAGALAGGILGAYHASKDVASQTSAAPAVNVNSAPVEPLPDETTSDDATLDDDDLDF